ncbi:MAG: hypothetical protein RL220_1140 [Bacteroidota bacterium]
MGYFRSVNLSKSSDTICALSTAQGMGAIALIRMSGPDSVEIAQRVFSGKLFGAASHTALHGWIMDGGNRLDEVVLTLFRGPRSFTGEDTVEIACHGSVYIQQRILQLLMEQGAVMARAGEFTMRAYLNGQMDLSQAEAVGDLIASESAAAHKQAIHQMRGGFSKEIRTLRERLIHFASMIELELDFAEEDVEFANRDELRNLLEEIRQIVVRLEDSFALGNAIRHGVPVAILGAPNMGKSTLLNALLNEDRAIVSEIPGTTRDTIEDSIVIEGIRFRFIDTAGLRHTSDEIEKLGIERSYAKAKEAALVLYVFDISTTSYEDLHAQLTDLRNRAGEGVKIIPVGNKVDKGSKDGYADDMVVEISAKSGLGMEDLRKRLLEESGSQVMQRSETIVTNARHHRALSQARESLDSALSGLNSGTTGDFLMVDIRRALYHLGEITGQIGSDDLLNHIFSTFCIGK